MLLPAGRHLDGLGLLGPRCVVDTVAGVAGVLVLRDQQIRPVFGGAAARQRPNRDRDVPIDLRAVAKLAPGAVDRRKVVYPVIRTEALHRAGGGHEAGHPGLLEATRRDLWDARARPIHRHRRAPALGCSVPELTRLVRAPALRRSRVGDRAGVVETGGDRCNPRQAGYRHGMRAVRSRPITELAGGVVPPALDRAGGHQRARMVEASRDLVDGAAQPGHVRRRKSVALRAVADLAVLTLPPALDAAAVRDPACVVPAGRDLRDGAQPGVRGDARWVPIAGAELTVAVVAPAPDGTRVLERATGIETKRDLLNAAVQALHVNRRDAFDQRPVAELAVAVVPPALHAAGVRHGARVIPHRLHVLHAGVQPAHRPRLEPVDLGAVANHADRVEAPAFRYAGRRAHAGVHRSGRDRGNFHCLCGRRRDDECAGYQADRRDDAGHVRPDPGDGETHDACSLLFASRARRHWRSTMRMRVAWSHTLAAASTWGQGTTRRRDPRPRTKVGDDRDGTIRTPEGSLAQTYG